MKQEVDISKKWLLTLEEAAQYTGIGVNKLRELSNNENCNFVLWVGNKRLIKKRLFDKYMASGKKDKSCYTEETVIADYNVFALYNNLSVSDSRQYVNLELKLEEKENDKIKDQ